VTRRTRTRIQTKTSSKSKAVSGAEGFRGGSLPSGVNRRRLENWRGLIREVGPSTHQPKPAGERDEALIRAIAYPTRVLAGPIGCSQFLVLPTNRKLNGHKGISTN
jgi:hypothetical protein